MAFCKKHGIDFCKKRGGFCRACRSIETGIDIHRCGCIYAQKKNSDYVALVAVCPEHQFFGVKPDIDAGAVIRNVEEKIRVV